MCERVRRLRLPSEWDEAAAHVLSVKRGKTI